MRQLGAADIVELAESSGACGPASLALQILTCADPGSRPEVLPLGRRDALLMGVRAKICGPKLELVSTCPDCGMALELNVTTAQLGLGAAAPDPTDTRTVSVVDREIAVRPLTAGDLAEAEQLACVDAVRLFLLQAAAPDAGTDDNVLTVVEDAVEALDPDAETLLDWSCPDCGADWSETIDAAALLAGDIRVRARNLLAEVALLARVYHWSERDILAMPAQRRRFYLEAAG